MQSYVDDLTMPFAVVFYRQPVTPKYNHFQSDALRDVAQSNQLLENKNIAIYESAKYIHQQDST